MEFESKPKDKPKKKPTPKPTAPKPEKGPGYVVQPWLK